MQFAKGSVSYLTDHEEKNFGQFEVEDVCHGALQAFLPPLIMQRLPESTMVLLVTTFG